MTFRYWDPLADSPFLIVQAPGVEGAALGVWGLGFFQFGFKRPRQMLFALKESSGTSKTVSIAHAKGSDYLRMTIC